MTLVENIDMEKKVKLVKIILNVSIDDENDDHFPNISKTAKRSGKRYIIDDSFNERGDQDGVQVQSAFNEEKYKDFVSNVKVYSSPAKKQKHSFGNSGKDDDDNDDDEDDDGDGDYRSDVSNRDSDEDELFNPNIFAEVKLVKKANGKDIEVKHSAFMRIDDVISKLQNPDNVLEAIPRGLKQNVFFIIHEDENME